MLLVNFHEIWGIDKMMEQKKSWLYLGSDLNIIPDILSHL